MLDTDMEHDADRKITFIELQTVKKDDFFDCENRLTSELHSSFSSPFIDACNPLVDIPSHTNCLENKIDAEQDFKHSEDQILGGCKNEIDFDSLSSNSLAHGESVRTTVEKTTRQKKWGTSPGDKCSMLKKKKDVSPTKSCNLDQQSAEISANRKRKCEYPRLCSGCGHAYKTKQSFWNHKQRCAMLPQNSMRNMAIDEKGFPVKESTNSGFIRRKEYICAHCERRYRKKYNLQEHLKNTCRGKPCSKGRLQCWENGCMQAFYKYVDLVQHVTLQHGQDLQIQKLSFPNLSAFNSWKTEESNSKFMYARKITGSKRFSNTKYHYFVCQFNHRNEKKNHNRKTNRRKSVNLVVPNYNCPSRIMVKECENQIQVTYISSHNHELNLANVKYQPLEKETRAYIKTLLQLGVSAKRIKDHLQEGVGNPEIDSFLSTKQHFLTLNRIKRMESKLKSKNRAQQVQEDKIDVLSDHLNTEDAPFFNEELNDPIVATSKSNVNKKLDKDSDEVIQSIESNLKRLRGYMHKSTVKERLSDRISKMIQELCDECEHVESIDEKPIIQRKPRSQNVSRKRKAAPIDLMTVTSSIPISNNVATAASITVSKNSQLHTQIAVGTRQPSTNIHQIQPILMDQHEPMQSHIILQQPVTIVNPNTIVANVITNVIESEKSFTPAIHETTDVLKPIYQPFNVNLLSLKSLDPYLPEREQILLTRVDECFSTGQLCDAVVNSFLNLIGQSMSSVITANTDVTEFVQLNQKVPDVWHCYNWGDIDTLFIPCNPSKKQWFLLVLLLKNAELQILDPTCLYESMPVIYKKYESSIQCWYTVLHNFLGISQCSITFPAHTKNENPINSGVLICWYVFQYINERNLADNVDTDVFRRYMYNTIVSSSSPVIIDVQEIR